MQEGPSTSDADVGLSQPGPKLRRAAWAAHLLLLLCQVALIVQEVAPFEPVYYTDGPFQVLNWVRRIDAGQRVGTDFPSFHGAAIPVVHWPLFRIFGADEVASEISRQAVSRLGTIAVLALVAWWARWNVVYALLAWPAIVFVGPIQHLAAPSNSSLGLRSLLPVLCVALLAREPENRWTRWWLALPLAGGWLLSYEQGTAMGIAMVAAIAVEALRRLVSGKANRAVELTVTLAISITLALLTLVVMSGSAGAKSVLHYAYVDIPGDQFWFFGAPPNPFMDIRRLQGKDLRYFAQLGFCLAAVLIAALVALRSSNRRTHALALASVAGFAYAALSSMGYLSNATTERMHPGMRVGALLLLLMMFDAEWLKEFWPSRRGKIAQGLLVTVVALGATVWLAMTIHETQLPIAPGGELEQSVAAVVEPVRKLGGPNSILWSTYAGPPERVLGIFNPHTDYMIHALGPKSRASYLNTFLEVKPEFVKTEPRSFAYEQWLQNSSWPFYEELLTQYSIVETTRRAMLWRRSPGPTGTTSPAVEIPLDRPIEPGGEVEVADRYIEDADLIVVQLEYQVHRPLEEVPMLRELARYLVRPLSSRAPGSVALPPYATQWQFPVVPRLGKGFQLKTDVAGVPLGATFEITRVSIRRLKTSPANASYFEGLPR